MSDDNELMARAQDGDDSAYEALVLKYRGAVIRFAAGMVSDIETAEDIAQECFAKIYINRMSYKPSHSFKTYLYAVIRNQCVDHLRSMRSESVVPLDDISEIHDGDTPDVLLFREERIAEALKMLNSLEADYKTALYLFAVDGMSYAEIAKVMKKTVPQIKITIHRARKKLKSLYEGVDICEK